MPKNRHWCLSLDGEALKVEVAVQSLNLHVTEKTALSVIRLGSKVSKCAVKHDQHHGRGSYDFQLPFVTVVCFRVLICLRHDEPIVAPVT